MSKAILMIDMPNCCDECFALDDNGDYPVCLITQEQRGYTFRTREQKMDRCPLKPIADKVEVFMDDWAEGCNVCLEDILKNKNEI